MLNRVLIQKRRQKGWENNWSEPELTDVNATLHHKPLGLQIPCVEQENTSIPMYFMYFMYFNNAAEKAHSGTPRRGLSEVIP